MFEAKVYRYAFFSFLNMTFFTFNFHLILKENDKIQCIAKQNYKEKQLLKKINCYIVYRFNKNILSLIGSDC